CRVVAALTDDRDEFLVLAQCGPRSARERFLLRQLGGERDQLGERLEEPELQICGLAEEGVDVGSELLEIDTGRSAEISSCAQREPTGRGARSLPEPLDHVASLRPARIRLSWRCP